MVPRSPNNMFTVRLDTEIFPHNWIESGRGQPHSKTYRRYAHLTTRAKRLGVRLPSAAFLLQSHATIAQKTHSTDA